MLTSIDTILNYEAPLVFQFNGASYEVPNLNTLSFKELNILKNSFLETTWLQWLSQYFDKDVVQWLSTNQVRAIFDQLEEHSGFTISEVASLFQTIEQYPVAFTEDLFRSGFTLFTFLDLKPLEALFIFRSILATTERSTLVAKIRNWKYAFGLQDYIAADLWLLLLQINSKNPNNVKPDAYGRFPNKEHTDINEELKEYNEQGQDQNLTDEEIDALNDLLLQKNTAKPEEVEKPKKKRKPLTDEQKKRYAANRAAKKELKQLTDKVISKN
jgi:hypothetical protein